VIGHAKMTWPRGEEVEEIQRLEGEAEK